MHGSFFLHFYFISFRFYFYFLLSLKELHVRRACFFFFSPAKCKNTEYKKRCNQRCISHNKCVACGCEERRKTEPKVGHLLMRWELEHGATPPAALPLHLQLSARKYSKQDTTIPASKPKKSATRGLKKKKISPVSSRLGWAWIPTRCFFVVVFFNLWVFHFLLLPAFGTLEKMEPLLS